MPTVYLRKDHYDALVKLGKDPTAFVNELLDGVLVKNVQYVPIKEKEKPEEIVQTTLPKKVRKV